MFSQILQHPLIVLITYLNVCRSHVSIWNKALEKGVGLVRPQTNKLLPLNNRFQFMTRTTTYYYYILCIFEMSHIMPCMYIHVSLGWVQDRGGDSVKKEGGGLTPHRFIHGLPATSTVYIERRPARRRSRRHQGTFYCRVSLSSCCGAPA